MGTISFAKRGFPFVMTICWPGRVSRATLSCSLVTPLWCHECVPGDCRGRLRLITFLAVLASLTVELCCESSAYAETKIIPSVTASQRYDSNVFRVPTSFLPPGTKSGDFVTALSPQLGILNKSDLGDTKFNIGVSGNVYANNSSLNYISTNANLNSDLTRWIRELIPGARLQIADSFLFTPEPPGFVTGVRPDTPSDAFARGVVAFRAN